MRTRGTDLLRNIGLSIVSAVLLLFLLEMLLRVTELAPVRRLEYAGPELWSVNPGPLLPGQTYTDRFKRSLPYHVSVNNLGFRGPDVPIRKPAGTLRVLCLGDSYTFGAYVDDAETWPAQLEAALEEERPERDVQAINAGIAGFTIVDEVDFLKEQGLRLEPDVVVIGFVLNDVADLTRRVSSRESLRRASLKRASSPFGPAKARLQRTAIYNAVSLVKVWARLSHGGDPTIQEVDVRQLLQPVYDQTIEDLFDQYRKHLASLKDLVDRHGVPLVLLIFPCWEQISQGATDQAQARVGAMAGELGIPVVDLLPSFRRHDPRGRKLFHMPSDHHPSARGHRMAARELADALLQLLPEGAQPTAQASDASI